MDFYLTLLLDIANPRFTFPRRVFLINYEAAVVQMCLPKCSGSFISIASTILLPQLSNFDHPVFITVPCIRGRQVKYRPTHLQYKKLLDNPDFDVLRFRFLNEEGKSVTFSPGKALLVLHFRPVK